MNDDFAIFIMVWGRPDRMWTYRSLRNQGYTGKVYFVADDLDETVEQYKEKYGDKLLVFSKTEASKTMDTGDNSGDLRSTLFSANKIRDLAREQGIKYYMIMCDDYTAFYHNFNRDYKFKKVRVKNMDKVLTGHLDFYKSIPATTIAMAQGGDFLGGRDGSNAEIKLMRKAMNTFFCDVDREFQFIGRLNEDVTTYVNLGSRGDLFLTATNICVVQKEHQSETKGLTDVYLDWGTYVKSFFTVMYNPSCVKIRELGTRHKRIHHFIDWGTAVPKILNEKYA